jgi:muconolactone delta-isomerase
MWRRRGDGHATGAVRVRKRRKKREKEKKEWDKIRDTWRAVSGWGDFLLFKTPHYY